MMRLLKSSMMLIVVLLIGVPLSGCSMKLNLVTTVPEQDIPRIELGISVESLVKKLEGKTYYAYRASYAGNSHDVFDASIETPLTHWFTVRHGQDSVLYVTSRVIQPNIAFVFINRHLASMHPPSWCAGGSCSPQNIERILQTESMTPEELVQYIKTTTETENRHELSRGRYSNLPPMPFFIVDLAMARMQPRLRRDAKLRAKYDPISIDAGMTCAEVEQHLGEDVGTPLVRSGKVVRLYGEESESMMTAYIAVTYESDQVVEVKSRCGSGPFFPPPALPSNGKPLENPESES